MATEVEMTAYERRRLENMKRNAAKLSSLSIINSSFLFPINKQRKWQKKNYQRSRSSLRTQGIPPSHPSGLPDDPMPSKSRTSFTIKGPNTIRNASTGDEEIHFSFVEKMTALKMDRFAGRMSEKEPVNTEFFKLESENVVQIVPNNLTTIQFSPTSDTVLLVAGNSRGHLGLWGGSAQDSNEVVKSVHLYQPHASMIYGISVPPFSLSKIYSCCADGLLRSMNIEREEFDHVYSSSSGSALYSLSQSPNDVNSLYIGEGLGGLHFFDERAGKIINSWSLHEGRINSIDVNPANTNVIATSSSDGLACMWDLRKMNNQHSECTFIRAFDAFSHDRCIRSAYFSPSASRLALTSSAHEVAVLSGPNFETSHIVHRRHLRDSLHTCSSAIWGWDDLHLYLGCNKRRVEVLSVAERNVVSTLESSLVPARPSRIDAHPNIVGMLAGASFTGKVFMWTTHDY